MKIFLFRHAESEDNEKHIFCGWRDPKLSKKGKIDCQELAELLKSKSFEFAYRPDLKRNLETLEEVLKFHPQTVVIIDQRIRERNYGDLQGQTHLSLMKSNLELYLKYHRSYDFPPPHGESFKMVEERVKPFYEEVLTKVKNERINIAICAGNNALRVLRKYLENLTVVEMLKIENPYDNYYEYEV